MNSLKSGIVVILLQKINNIKKLVVISIFIIFLLFSIKCSSGQNSSNVVKIILDDKTLTTYNLTGHTLWIKEFHTEINVKHIFDLNSDGINEIIIGTGSIGQNPGYLYVYDSNGNLQFNIKTGNISVYGRSEIYRIMDILIFDFDYDNNYEILVNSNNDPWYPNRLLILDNAGSIIGDYWHPGTVETILIADYKNDGSYEIFCGGLNNDYEQGYYRPVFFILDPFNSFGQAPPYMGNAEHGTELFYKTLDKSKIAPNSCSVRSIKQIRDEIEITLSDSRFYYYNINDMELIRTGVGDSYRFRLEKIEQEKINTIWLLIIGGIVGAIISLSLDKGIKIIKNKQKKKE